MQSKTQPRIARGVGYVLQIRLRNTSVLMRQIRLPIVTFDEYIEELRGIWIEQFMIAVLSTSALAIEPYINTSSQPVLRNRYQITAVS